MNILRVIKPRITRNHVTAEWKDESYLTTEDAEKGLKRWTIAKGSEWRIYSVDDEGHFRTVSKGKIA